MNPIEERIQALLQEAMLKDSSRARKKLERLGFGPEAALAQAGRPLSSRLVHQLGRIEKELRESAELRRARLRQKPVVRYPASLPITAKRGDIVRAIKEHPVLIVAGETGCGKSTQLPKMCLEAGQGIAGKIACTQPRRIAAVTIAHRIAEELGEPLGHSVGYKIRFQDKTPPQAYIKIMTDGMLLAETQGDRWLHEYDTVILDEAHERSLNIDFLLGLLRTLRRHRPELKVLITSATLDTEKFSQAFDHAPVIEVSGRTYPVAVEYRPAESFGARADPDDYVDLAVRAVEELKVRKEGGDILVFMPTEQDILETCQRLEGKNYRGTTILPLYARLPASHQGRVYSVRGPKIVVATNVAETSLTIPGIRYVVDTGLARISQYQPGTRINSLPISPVSRASADQRQGRCGRVQEGLCLRLYSEEDYLARPLFTPPEILRSNLAEVILRMLDLGLGHPADFPFVDKPDPRAIKDGFETLVELGAATGHGREYELTPLGRQMARLPLDPRLSRILLEAVAQECLPEVAVIAAALSIRDPRERPPEKAGLADQVQAKFSHPDSDFLTLLNIWEAFSQSEKDSPSLGGRKKFCHDHFLSFPRMREWVFVHDQIQAILEEQKILFARDRRKEISPGLYARIHKAILSGFLSNVAVIKEKNVYRAAKGREVILFPGSTLFKKSRPWVVAAEIVRTARLYARTVARIEPAWVEEVGRHCCKYSYADPRFDEDRGEVRAKEKVSFFGLELISDRDVAFGPRNPEEAHRIFIREALVEGRIKDPPAFLAHNLALQEKIRLLEEKLRRRDILTDEQTIASFYSSRLPGIYDRRGLEKRLDHPASEEFLKFNEKDLYLSFPGEDELTGFPDSLSLAGRTFHLSYCFAPGDAADGVTLQVPFSDLALIPEEELDWVVPGLLRKKVAALIRGLSKSYRKKLMPLQEKIDVILREIKRSHPSLLRTLASFVRQNFQVDIPESEWARVELPAHLRLRIAVLDDRGREVAASRNLSLLRRGSSIALSTDQSPEWMKARAAWEREDIRNWDFGPLPESILVGPFQVAYPGLERTGEKIGLRLFRTREEALTAHVRGVAALLEARFVRDVEFLRRYLVVFEEYERTALYFGGREALEKAMLENIKREIFHKNLRSREELEAYGKTVLEALFEKSHRLRETTLAILCQHDRTRAAIQTLERSSRGSRRLFSFVAEVKAHLDHLLPRHFLEIYDLERLGHLPRFLKAIETRVERARLDLEKDSRKVARLSPFTEALDRLSRKIARSSSPEKKRGLEELRWMIEEFRVSLFAPELGTAMPVSPKRLALKIKELEAPV